MYHLLANIQLARARKAPKLRYDYARMFLPVMLFFSLTTAVLGHDIISKEKLKEGYHQLAAQHLNVVDGLIQGNNHYALSTFLTRGNLIYSTACNSATFKTQL